MKRKDKRRKVGSSDDMRDNKKKVTLAYVQNYIVTRMSIGLPNYPCQTRAKRDLEL